MEHAPILLSTVLLRPHGKRQFKFEFGWMIRDGFLDMVKEVWARPVASTTPIQSWNNKIRSMRKHLGDWAWHTTVLKKEKSSLSSIFYELEEIAEGRP